MGRADARLSACHSPIPNKIHETEVGSNRMEFTLHYSGPLKAATPKNRRKHHKHCLRRHFHRQLQTLWDLPAMATANRSLVQPGPESKVLQRVGPFEFIPLVARETNVFASLEVVMLRPEPDGKIFERSGDIDNRLKTLMDALKVPNESSALPEDAAPLADESPFVCVLEDDSLVTSIDIQTAHWLEPEAQDSDNVVLLLRFRTELTGFRFGGIVLVG